MEILRTIDEVRRACKELKRGDRTLGSGAYNGRSA
jgi:hypothetical protein